MLNVYPGDTEFIRAVYGEKADAFVDYARGGYAKDEDIVVLKVTYSMNREELSQLNSDEREAADTIQAASSPEEAMEWIRSAQTSSAKNYYFMPNYEKTSFSKLYLYRMNELEKYQSMYHYVIPEDPAQFYHQDQMPCTLTLHMINE